MHEYWNHYAFNTPEHSMSEHDLRYRLEAETLSELRTFLNSNGGAYYGPGPEAAGRIETLRMPRLVYDVGVFAQW